MVSSTIDTWLLAAGIGLWVLILFLAALVLFRLYLRAKAYRRLQAAYTEESARVAREFESTHPTAPNTEDDLPVPPGGTNDRERQRGLRSRMRGALDLLSDAIMLPPPSADPEVYDNPLNSGISPTELDEHAPMVLSPKADSGLNKGSQEEVTCSICLEPILPGTMQRSLLCSHVYHPNCIKLWCSRANRCPQCQAEVAPTPKASRPQSDNSQEGAAEAPPGTPSENSQIAISQADREPVQQAVYPVVLIPPSLQQHESEDRLSSNVTSAIVNSLEPASNPTILTNSTVLHVQ